MKSKLLNASCFIGLALLVLTVGQVLDAQSAQLQSVQSKAMQTEATVY